MTARLHDLQQGGDAVVTAATVEAVLGRYRKRAPFIAELRSDAPFMLTIGIAPTFGFVQHRRVDGQPPYLIAHTRDAVASGIMEFLITDTPTEISSKYRLPSADIASIVSFFIETGERSDAYLWESI